MTQISTNPLDTQTAVLHAAGLGIQALLGDLDQAKAELAARNDRANAELEARRDRFTANLAKLDRIMLRLYNLAEDLNERGGKVSGPKLAAQLHAIRDDA